MRSGKNAEARKLLSELKEFSKRRDVSWCSFAAIYAGLGETDQAFASLEKPFDQRDAGLVINMRLETPMFDRLRSDPRFQELLRRIGLPP